MEPAIGTKTIRVVSIEGFPFNGHPGILNALNGLPVKYRLSSRFIFFDTEEAKVLVNKLQKKWRQKIRGFKDQLLNSTSGPIDEDSMGMMQDANGAMAEAASGLVRHGHYTTVVVLMGDNRTLLDESTAIAQKAIRDSGFTCRVETINSIEAYLGSLPGEGVCNVRRPIIHTLNFATLLPTSASWQGLQYNPCPFYPEKSPPLFYAQTTGSAPFRVGLHVGDVGHTLILGPTGSGKSTLLQFIQAQQFRYPMAKVFGFDKGYSAFVLCHAAGGRHYDLGGEHESLSFCPLARVDEPQERMWAADWIETLLAVNKFKVLPQHRNIINYSLKLIGKADLSQRTMSHFVATLPDMAMREALESSTVAGGNELLDGENDDLTSGARFQIFEMEHLMEMGEKHVIPALLYLFHHIQRQLDGSPTLLVLDEAWLMLAHPLFQEKIKEWLKVLRKANTAVVFATQSISDIGNSPIRDVIYESCQTKILLPNPTARENENSLVQYRAIGLNERQIDLIASAKPKRDYYYMSPLGKRMFRLGLGRVNLAFVGASDKDSIKSVRDLMERHGDEWVPNWLHVRGLTDWGNYWRTL
jgi:type IV secretion system protein VirB4